MTRTILLFTSSLLLILRSAFGDSVTYTVTPNGVQFDYAFTLTNTGDTGGPVFDLFLSVLTDISNIDTSDLGTPIGWGDPAGGLVFYGPDVNPGTSFIEWSADGSGLYDLALGNLLSGFTFTSAQDFTNPILFATNGSSNFETAQQISSSPEPAASRMLLLFLVIMGLLRLREIRCFRDCSKSTGITGS